VGVFCFKHISKLHVFSVNVYTHSGFHYKEMQWKLKIIYRYEDTVVEIKNLNLWAGRLFALIYIIHQHSLQIVPNCGGHRRNVNFYTDLSIDLQCFICTSLCTNTK